MLKSGHLLGLRRRLTQSPIPWQMIASRTMTTTSDPKDSLWMQLFTFQRVAWERLVPAFPTKPTKTLLVTEYSVALLKWHDLRTEEITPLTEWKLSSSHLMSPNHSGCVITIYVAKRIRNVCHKYVTDKLRSEKRVVCLKNYSLFNGLVSGGVDSSNQIQSFIIWICQIILVNLKGTLCDFKLNSDYTLWIGF